MRNKSSGYRKSCEEALVFYHSGCTIAEIALKQGINPSSAYRRIKRAEALKTQKNAKD